MNPRWKTQITAQLICLSQSPKAGDEDGCTAQPESAHPAKWAKAAEKMPRVCPGRLKQKERLEISQINSCLRVSRRL